MTKEQPWANRSHRSVKKTTWRICSSHKRAIRSEKFMFYMFFTVFHCFSSFLCPRVKCSHCSLLSCSFLKSSGSDLLSLLWTKEQPWGNCSHHSLKRLTVSGSLFFLSKSHFRSQKTSNSLKKPMSKFPTLDRQHLQNWKDTTVETGFFHGTCTFLYKLVAKFLFILYVT